MDDGINEAFRLLETAKLLEKDGQRIEASTKYYEGCHLMRQIASNVDGNLRIPQREKDSIKGLLKEKIEFYTQQAQRLYFDEPSVMQPQPIPKTPTTPATIILSTKTVDDISVLTLPGNQSSILSEMGGKTGIGNARLEQAIRLEEDAKKNQAIMHHNDEETIVRSYMSAAEAYIEVLRLAEESSLAVPTTVQSRLEACFERIEALKRRPIGRPMGRKSI